MVDRHDQIAAGNLESGLVCTDIDVGGMHCAACAGRVERALAQVPGVVSAQVNLVTERARVQADAATPRAALQAAVERAGYKVLAAIAEPIPGRAPERNAEQKQGRAPALPGGASIWPIAAALALTAPLLAPMLARPWGASFVLPAAGQWLLATVLQFGFGARFYLGAWGALRARSGNMDLLIALGTTAAYGLSVFEYLDSAPGAMPHLYFEASASVISLVLLGKWLEGRAKRQAVDAMRALQSLRPETARRLQAGVETVVPIAAVGVGAELVVLPGERIPLDGEITQGRSHVDESLITGESLPVAKVAGERVIGGALNAEGRLQMRVTAIGAETTIARIVRRIEDAQAAKAPVERVVDRVSAVFVPAILALAALTFLAWWFAAGDGPRALINAVSVLVIACPCALGLATPMAILVGTSRAARAGILIQDAQALEHARAVTVLAFDKTGTLTTGRARLVAMEPLPGLAEDTLLALAAAALSASNHPLALAVGDAARARAIATPEIRDGRTLAGRGVQARVGERMVYVGSARWMEELGVDTHAAAVAALRHEDAGRTVSWIAAGASERAARLLGVLAFGDALKPGAAAAVAALRARGVRVVLLSGDNDRSARAIARETGIEEIHARLLPEEKAARVAALKAGGAVVAMVGDGINDAPALAAADVGFALGSGTDLARAVAGITLMRDDPRLVVSAIDVSQRTFAKVRQNLFWAFAYNVVGIPLAAFGLLSPGLAGACMALSSLSVVSNALLLRRWRATQD